MCVFLTSWQQCYTVTVLNRGWTYLVILQGWWKNIWKGRKEKLPFSLAWHFLPAWSGKPDPRNLTLIYQKILLGYNTHINFCIHSTPPWELVATGLVKFFMGHGRGGGGGGGGGGKVVVYDLHKHVNTVVLMMFGCRAPSWWKLTRGRG